MSPATSSNVRNPSVYIFLNTLCCSSAHNSIWVLRTIILLAEDGNSHPRCNQETIFVFRLILGFSSSPPGPGPGGAGRKGIVFWKIGNIIKCWHVVQICAPDSNWALRTMRWKSHFQKVKFWGNINTFPCSGMASAQHLGWNFPSSTNKMIVLSAQMELWGLLQHKVSRINIY